MNQGISKLRAVEFNRRAQITKTIFDSSGNSARFLSRKSIAEREPTDRFLSGFPQTVPRQLRLRQALQPRQTSAKPNQTSRMLVG